MVLHAAFFFTYSYIQYLPSSYYGPGTIPSDKKKAGSKTKCLPLKQFICSEKRQAINKYITCQILTRSVNKNKAGEENSELIASAILNSSQG